RAFDASQTELDLVSVAFSLGLAASVLYLGAIGDRYGRKLLLVTGVVLSVPACIVAALAPSIPVLIGGRLLGGLAAGMAYPTTLALITALWSGPKRTKSIALWSGLGGAMTALGPLAAGWLLLHFYWGSVFYMTLPLAAVALALAVVLVPAHVNETTDAVDNLGGVISIVFVAALVLAINFAAVPGKGPLAIGLAVITVVAGVGFFVRQRTAKDPLYDLHLAARRVFWVAACAGIIVFGALMGAMFVGQQFLQNVLGYDTFEAGAAILPAAALMVVAAPISARMVRVRGSRTTLLAGYVFCLLGFLTMLWLWNEGIAYGPVALGYAFIGIGVGLAGTPASHSLTGSVPVQRSGMASGTADLQRDLGGAIMQSVLGSLLTAGYAAAFAAAIAGAPTATRAQVTDRVANELQKSFAGAATIAEREPQYAQQIIEAARTSFVDGANWAYTAGIVAVVLGAAMVFFAYPKKDEEERLLRRYAGEDAPEPASTAPSGATP
ncbi:MAG: MFS transporter, partial [Acidimicrobiales bacterium]